jgi:membrane-associated phospholipid phosphatase
MYSTDYPPSPARLLVSLVLCAALVAACYFFVDPAVAFWADRMALRRYAVFEAFTHLPDVIVWLSVLYYVVFACTYERQLGARRPLLDVANSVTIAVFLKDALKYVFGRYWPATWVNNNPSLLHDHAYGFHLFHAGAAYQSFPSGHTTVAFAAMAALWIGLPRWRWLAVLVPLLVVAGLLAMDYHFVGDCIAGAWLGTTVARYVTAHQRERRARVHL